MRLILLFAVLLFSVTRCLNNLKPGAKEKDKAQFLVDKAVAAHGGESFKNALIAFDFRGRHYTSVREGDRFTYTRSFTDSTGQVTDILNNTGFTRKLNGQKVNLPAERQAAFTASVNSVIYFALLPFGLNDPAVKKTYLGLTPIRQQPYHKIKVTFAQEGGGTDYQDTFVYYLHPEKYTLDYLAYSYETDGGGMRFREAYDPIVVGGIRFQKYINYEPQTDSVAVTGLDKLYNLGKLKELSRIEPENIQVTIHK